MWLHNTATLELRRFNTPEEVPGGYAILSHVWDAAGEQDFQDFQAIWEEHKLGKKTVRSDVDNGGRGIVATLFTSIIRAPGRAFAWLRTFWFARFLGHFVRFPPTPPASPLPNRLLKRISPKIRSFCKLAQKQGYNWAWADMSCINKESSAELSETINSMFRYYALADVCFVYLADVPPSDTREGLPWSKWYTRGWTLQELLAPRLVVFLDQNWTIMGTKTDFSQELSKRTGIPESVLRFEQDMYEISIAARMSWASDRSTTRVEDEAYCLMGIFGINMPTLYGEGRNAFYRLQEEIMKTSTDTSLFAWGDFRSGNTIHGVINSSGPADPFSMAYLFAPSTSCFSQYSNIVNDGSMTAVEIDQPRQNLSDQCPAVRTMIPTFTVTPRGVLVYAPVLERNGDMILLLSCSAIDENGTKRRLTMLLEEYHTQGEAPLDQPLHRICLRTSGGFAPPGPRIRQLDPAEPRPQTAQDPQCQGPPKPSWRSVYIVARQEQRADPSPQILDPLRRFTGTVSPPPFRFPLATCKEFASWGPSRHQIILDSVSRDVSEPWKSDSPPIAVVFKLSPMGGYNTSDEKYLTISMSLCAHIVGGGTSKNRLGSHYATVQLHHNRPNLETTNSCKSEETQQLRSHSCPHDHIVTWPSQKKTFKGSAGLLNERGSADVYITLGFVPCPMNPESTLLLKHFDARVVNPRNGEVQISSDGSSWVPDTDADTGVIRFPEGPLTGEVASGL